MPTMTPQEFAATVKKKYPQYANVPDEQLARAVVQKYPQYASQVNLGTGSHDTVSATPTLHAKDYLQLALAMPRSPAAKSAAYTAIDKLLPFLPAAGATVGGMAVGPESGFLAAPAGAAEGAALGETLRQGLNRLIFGEKTTPEDFGKGIAEQAILGGVTEGAARGVGALGSKVVRPFKLAAPTVRDARAGAGIRMTPGEASGSATLKRVESVLGHLPGGAGPIEGFREAQIADAKRLMNEPLNQLSATRMSQEEAGQAVQKALRDQADTRTKEVTGKFNEVKKLLGIDPKTFMTPQQLNDAVAKKAEFYKQMGGGEPAVVRKLEEARRAHAGNPQSAMVDKLLESDPETIINNLQTKFTSAQLREFNNAVPEPVRRQAAANVLQKMLTDSADAQNGIINQRSLAISLKRMGPNRGRLLFGKQYDAIAQGSRLLNQVAPLASDASGGLGKMHTLTTLVGLGSVASGALLGHGASTAAVVGTPVVAMRLISMALARPETSAAMLKALRAAAVTGTRAIPYGVDAFSNEPAPIEAR